MRWATVSILILIWNWLCWRSFICSSRVTFIPSPSNTVHQEQELSGQDEGLPSPLTSVGLEHWWTLAGDQRNKESEVGCLLLCTIASSVKDHILFKAVFRSLSTLLLFPLLIGVVMGTVTEPQVLYYPLWFSYFLSTALNIVSSLNCLWIT